MRDPSEPLVTTRRDDGFADLSDRRIVAVRGSDAATWLNDLISADIAGLQPGVARRALLLSPTGGVLASFSVTIFEGDLIVVQDRTEPRPIDGLLARYILSSDVRLEDLAGRLALFGFPGLRDAPLIEGTARSSPSVLGAGVDLLSSQDRARLAATLSASFPALTAEELEAWRIASGIPRVGIDTVDGDLPGETGLLGAVSFDKGCFLGQEAVAKVRNGGHPRRLVLPFESDDVLEPGDEVHAEDAVAGIVTSVAEDGGRHLFLARIAWAHRDAAFTSGRGSRLLPIGPTPVPPRRS
jgi:folate-binding protein YgfZ